MFSTFILLLLLSQINLDKSNNSFGKFTILNVPISSIKSDLHSYHFKSLSAILIPQLFQGQCSNVSTSVLKFQSFIILFQRVGDGRDKSFHTSFLNFLHKWILLFDEYEFV